MQQVYTAQNEMDAHFLKGLLIEQGIQAIVQGEALEQVWGTLPLTQTSLPTVWVPDDAVGTARPIVEDYNRNHRRNQVAEGLEGVSSWVCPNCGEKLEAQFSQCWKCGTARSDPSASL